MISRKLVSAQYGLCQTAACAAHSSSISVAPFAEIAINDHRQVSDILISANLSVCESVHLIANLTQVIANLTHFLANLH